MFGTVHDWSWMPKQKKSLSDYTTSQITVSQSVIGAIKRRQSWRRSRRWNIIKEGVWPYALCPHSQTHVQHRWKSEEAIAVARNTKELRRTLFAHTEMNWRTDGCISDFWVIFFLFKSVPVIEDCEIGYCDLSRQVLQRWCSSRWVRFWVGALFWGCPWVWA